MVAGAKRHPRINPDDLLPLRRLVALPCGNDGKARGQHGGLEMQPIGQRPILIGERADLYFRRDPHYGERGAERGNRRPAHLPAVPFRLREEYLHRRGGLLDVPVRR